MTLRELLNDIRKLVEEHPEALDLQVLTTNGSSGCSEELSGPSLQEADEDVMDIHGITGNYVDFYNGK